MKKTILLSILCIFFAVAELYAKEITICSDQNFFYPFTFTEKNKAAGLHIEIIKMALEDLGYTAKITPRPWEKCLQEVKNGDADAVATASYKKNRAEFMHYPFDAATFNKSRWRVTQVEYVVVTNSKDPYKFYGDVKSLPKPVRAPAGYSIIDDLKEQGIEVDVTEGFVESIVRLVDEKKGVVITLPEAVKIIQRNEIYTKKLKVQVIPVKSKSYFFAFSKKGKISEEERKKIWEKIAQIRQDLKLMKQILNKYTR